MNRLELQGVASSNTADPAQEVKYAVVPLTIGSKTFHYLFTHKVLHGMMSPSCSIGSTAVHPSAFHYYRVFPIVFPLMPTHR
ncbi:MAG: hypothetical protein K0S36_609 [Nitrosospira multiformis]|nr:hypothetical protein [Nitrosospira multiformis]